MINISEIVATWPKDENGWSISPGVEWCAAGNHIRCGFGVVLGNGARVGDYASVGNFASVGNDARVGDYARSILADLGAEQGRGYGRAAYIAANGAVRISAGCRDFSIAEARAHWGAADYPDRKRGDEYLALIDYVERLAEINGATK